MCDFERTNFYILANFGRGKKDKKDQNKQERDFCFFKIDKSSLNWKSTFFRKPNNRVWIDDHKFCPNIWRILRHFSITLIGIGLIEGLKTEGIIKADIHPSLNK